MRALVCKELGSFENLSIETVDDPTPGKGEVLIDVAAAGINFPDLLVVAGKYQFKPPLPFIPGGECSGVVSAVGDGVKRIKVGDRVIAMGLVGSFAEKIAVAESATLPIPEGMSFEAAAGIAFTYGTSHYALQHQARLQEGETLVVLGAAGGVGTTAVELGKATGATVIAAASSDEKLAAAAEAGADHGINYSTEPLKERIKDLTEGRGADVIYDPVGGDYSEQALRAVAWDGRYLVIGFAAGEIPKIPLNLILLKSAHVIGVFWGTWTQREPAAASRSFYELQQMFESGKLTPRITPYPLAEFGQALGALAARKAVGKLVLTM